MRALLLSEYKKLSVVEMPTPEIGDDEALVRVRACGICGSDLHAAHLRQVYRGGYTLGHEPAGHIAALGEGVTGWRVGQRV